MAVAAMAEVMEEAAMEDMAEVMEAGMEVTEAAEAGMAVMEAGMAVMDMAAGMGTMVGMGIIMGTMAIIMAQVMAITVTGEMADMIRIFMVLPIIMTPIPVITTRLLRRLSISMTAILIPMITGMEDMIILPIRKIAVKFLMADHLLLQALLAWGTIKDRTLVKE